MTLSRPETGKQARPQHSAAVACADVTSANIVGYAQNALDEDGFAVMVSPQFATVGSTDASIKAGDITLSYDEAVDPYYAVLIQFLNPDGSTDLTKTLSWGEGFWEDTHGADASNQDIPAGQGLWVYNQTYEPVAFRSSGEVSKKPIIAPLNEDGFAAACGNGFPVAVKAGTITLVYGDDVDPYYAVLIQFLNSDGSTDLTKTLSWGEGFWEDTHGADASNQDIPAGQGLWVYNQTYEPVSLIVAAPEF